MHPERERFIRNNVVPPPSWVRNFDMCSCQGRKQPRKGSDWYECALHVDMPSIFEQGTDSVLNKDTDPPAQPTFINNHPSKSLLPKIPRGESFDVASAWRRCQHQHELPNMAFHNFFVPTHMHRWPERRRLDLENARQPYRRPGAEWLSRWLTPRGLLIGASVFGRDLAASGPAMLTRETGLDFELRGMTFG